MKTRFAMPVASAATAILLLGACGDGDDSSTETTESTATTTSTAPDDGPTTLAKGEDIDFVGSEALGAQTMDILAEDEDGVVTGEVSFEPHGSVASLQCAETEPDGVIFIGGPFTDAPDDGDEIVGTWVTVAIRGGDPDSAFVWFADHGLNSCGEAFEQVRNLELTEADYTNVEEEDDIETG